MTRVKDWVNNIEMLIFSAQTPYNSERYNTIFCICNINIFNAHIPT